MSHQDSVTDLPQYFEIIAQTDGPFRGTPAPAETDLYPPVSPRGQGHPLRFKILANFAEICGMPKNWSMQNFISLAKEQIRQEVASQEGLMFLSGGVDSSSPSPAQ